MKRLAQSAQPRHECSSRGRCGSSLLFLALFLALTPKALASTNWYVDGAHGSDNNNCSSPQTSCKTIGHTISLASSGDSIMVAAATYTENLIIGFSLKVIGSGANTTIIDGGAVNTVVSIPNAAARVFLSRVSIRNGRAQGFRRGGGIFNNGTLTINNSTVHGNSAAGSTPGIGGGIDNGGTLTINNSTITANVAAYGGGIYNSGTGAVNNSTISGNGVGSVFGDVAGGGIYNGSILTIKNSTIQRE